MKKAILLFFLSLSFLRSNSQNEVGAKLNVGMSTVKTTFNYNVNSPTRNFVMPSAQAGIFYHIPLKDHFTFGIEFLFSQVEGKQTSEYHEIDQYGNPTGIYSKYKEQQHFTYLAFPVYIGYAYKKIELDLGLRINYLALPFMHTTYSSNTTGYDETFRDIPFNKLDFGVNAGVLFRLSRKFTINGDFYQEFNNSKGYAPFYNRTVIQATVGLRYTFDPKKNKNHQDSTLIGSTDTTKRIPIDPVKVEKKKHNLGFIASVQFFNHTNGGLYFTGNDYTSKNATYEGELEKSIHTFSLGVRYKRLFQVIDLGYKKAKGIYTVDFGSDALSTKYFAYSVWFDPIKKSFPVKPLAALSLAYIEKDYMYHPFSEWGGGNTSSRLFTDKSSTFAVQIPVGLFFNYKMFFMNVAYYIPVFAQIKGSWSDLQSSHSVSGGDFSSSSSGNYSGNASSENVRWQKNVISLRVGCLIR